MLGHLDFNFLLKLLLIFVLQNAGNSEFYSSVYKMSKLVNIESKFVNVMERFVTANEQKLEYLKKRLAEFEYEHNASLAMGERQYYDNPVNKYLLVKRLSVDWERLENLMADQTGIKFLEKLEKYTQAESYPGEVEYEGAMEGLLRLQNSYRLNTKDLAAGKLRDIQYGTTLSAENCFDIGQQAAKINLPKYAHAWLTMSLTRLDAETADQPLDNLINKATALFKLGRVKSKLGDIKGANATLQEVIQLVPDDEVFTKGYEEFLEEQSGKESIAVDYSSEHEPIPADLSTASDHLLYKLTCSGDLTQTPTEERYLRCGYLTETHDFLRLAPIKVEEVNHFPLIVIFYDVISDREIEIIKNITDQRYVRATVIGSNSGMVSKVRTSQFSFADTSLHPVLKTIEVRTGDMTGLNMKYSEMPQFANYGIGGHYAEHFDWFDRIAFDTNQVFPREMGNRIATVLFYMSDVEQGGGTAFPKLRRLLLPKKGAAAFWFNLHASGEPDTRTLHGACPIIVGSKWVHNRWIRERDQSDRRPCEVWNDHLEVMSLMQL